ncbi:MAG: hypothetical protein DI598_12760 [Pseudopedobacter saltans]|uniref:ADP-ribosylation/Crystallin J1 n=1 Tax=Pseudopedobacter saltans TaxID=151895 RepID=A0A2W5ETR8_9SPHI|nr:MAG: hypothetical protein DI598_12760 [Pseudopedobacter saltans]
MTQLAKDILLGTAIGDALGVPYEFESRQQRNVDPATGMTGNRGFHNQSVGTWSDDTSMSLCLAEALLKEPFSLYDVADNFIQWFENGYWTANGDVFDVGNTTRNAIMRLEQGVIPERAGDDGLNQNGNGSLMRILPLLLLIKDYPLYGRFEWVSKISGMTHRHAISVFACYFYLEFANLLVVLKDKWKTYGYVQNNLKDYIEALSIDVGLEYFGRLLNGNIGEIPKDEIKSTGFVIDTLEASIWCLLNTDNYKEAVLLAVNLGDDTDTTAAVTGGLAGILYGYATIPKKWLNVLKRKDDIIGLAEKLDNIYCQNH